MGSIEKEYNLSPSAPMVDWPSACVQGGRVGLGVSVVPGRPLLILSNNPRVVRASKSNLRGSFAFKTI